MHNFGSPETYHVRNQTGTAHLLDGMLGRLGLFFAVDDGDVGDGNAEEVVTSKAVS